MNWDAVGAIGEVLGAVTVIATLFYLSRQIAQNSHALERSNEFARANAIHGSNAQFSAVFGQLAQDDELASIYHRALAGEALGDSETVRFQAFVSTFFAWLEDLYTQSSMQLSFAELEERGVDAMLLDTWPYCGRLLKTAAGHAWWVNDAAHLFSPTFRGVVDGALGQGQASEFLTR